MAIRKALLNGKTVYAEQGEELRGAELTCIHCGAKMHLHRLVNMSKQAVFNRLSGECLKAMIGCY